jgi:hypothetical protein
MEEKYYRYNRGYNKEFSPEFTEGLSKILFNK